MLFTTGKQFPDQNSIPRLAKYKRGKSYFNGTQQDLYERATEILKDTPHAKNLNLLYIACNIIDPLTTKPADMLFGEPPIYESGYPDDSEEQRALNRIVEENDLNKQGFELVLGGGIRGDAWLKTIYDYREDYSEYVATFGDLPPEATPEVIIEVVPGQYVFPEVSQKSIKKFKAINICFVTYEDPEDTDTQAYLNVERHIPGHIFYYKYYLSPGSVNMDWGSGIQTWIIGEQIELPKQHEETGLPFIPVFHCPYKSLDDQWEGVSNIEKVESTLSAIMDRLVQIDYILWKHSDPTAYGPKAGVDQVKLIGRYIGLDQGDVTPGYMEWNSQLTAAFEELDRLIGMVFAICETPQWIFGSAFTNLDSGGTGTSHTDGAAIKARFMPIISKVNRIRMNVDSALRDALWTAQLLEQYVRNKYNVTEIPEYEPSYPKIIWKDGLPQNDKELAEIMQIRLASGTIDTLSAIKQLEGMDDDKARMILEAIQKDKKQNIENMNQAISFELDWDTKQNEEAGVSSNE